MAPRAPGIGFFVGKFVEAVKPAMYALPSIKGDAGSLFLSAAAEIG